ncbi:MAG: hypothetical protein ACR2QT_12740 [Woeseiaceae bacterium]
MDKLANRLRRDADQIEVVVSPELDDRIRASIEGATQDRAAVKPNQRPTSFWWASSLTGVAATLAVIGVINLSGPEPEIPTTEPPVPSFAMPQFDWKPKTAMLTETLEQELQDIQSDLKKAEQAVKEDFDEVL